MPTYRIRSKSGFALAAIAALSLGVAVVALTIYAFWTSNVLLMVLFGGYWLYTVVRDFRSGKERLGLGTAVFLIGNVMFAYGLTQHNWFLIIVGLLMTIRLTFSSKFSV